MSENFLRDIAAIPFMENVATLLKMTCLEYISMTVNSKGNFSCVTDNVAFKIKTKYYRIRNTKLNTSFTGRKQSCFSFLL